MAINAAILDLILNAARQLPAGPRRMLCLGYPDMLVTEPQLAAALGTASARIAWRDDSAAILRWHGVQMPRVAETRSVFAALGIACDFVDIVASRGCEVVQDLNIPASAEFTGRYDIVYDGGTMEHCFNVGQVMRNILGFVRVGGFVVHANPLNYPNHGFFSFSPTFYHDWYTQSGNAIVSPFYVMSGPVLAPQLATVDAKAPFQAPERSVLVVAAMRTSAAEPGWPTQSKYLSSPELKG